MQREYLSPLAYPAMISNTMMAVTWLLIAALICTAVFVRPDAFSLLNTNTEQITFLGQMALVATSLKALGGLAPLTRYTQLWQIRALKRNAGTRGKKLAIPPTFRGAVIMGGIFAATGSIISICLGHDVQALCSRVMNLLFG